MCIHERKGSISFSSLTQDPFYGRQAAKQSQATVKLFKIKKKKSMMFRLSRLTTYSQNTYYSNIHFHKKITKI